MASRANSWIRYASYTLPRVPSLLVHMSSAAGVKVIQSLLPWLNSSPSFVLFRLKSYRAPRYAAQPVLLSFPWRPGVSGSSLNIRPPPNAFVFVFGRVMLKPPDPKRWSLPGPMSLRALSRVSSNQSMSPRSVEGRRLEKWGASAGEGLELGHPAKGHPVAGVIHQDGGNAGLPRLRLVLSQVRRDPPRRGP